MSRSSLRRLAGPAIAGSLALVGSVLPVLATPAAAASSGLVISQVYGAGGNSGATLSNDYVELFNRGSAPVSTAGMSVQYASATGTGNFAATELPDRTVPAGGYFLVQMSGGANGAALPAPDATGAAAMAAGAGKVALATGTTSLGCNGGSAACSAEQLARVVDLVGYGGANFFEGAAAAPALSPTTAALRAGAGCTDTDQNGADFTAGSPAPRNAGTAPAPCAPTGGPATPIASCPTALAAAEGEATSAELSATDADSRVVSATTTSAVAGIALSPVTASSAAGQPATVMLDVAATAAAGRYPVEVTFATDDAQVQTVSCTVVVSIADALTVAEVQGPGATSPYTGDLVAVRGVVVGDYQGTGEFGGFSVQSLQPDADPRTSEGVRVVVDSTAVAVGDLVQVVGTVAERASSSSLYTGSETQLASSSVVTVLGQAGVPAPTPVTLPFAETVGGVDGQERYEGMLVRLTNTDLVATDLFTLGRFGEVSLTTGDLLYIPTTEQEAAANDRDRITLDDSLSGQNLPTLPYTIGSDGQTLPRAGDRVAAGETVEGVLTYAFGEWRILPEVGTEVAFSRSEPRPETPENVGGDVQVASFNVLNYFVDFGGQARGADNAAELARQQAKLVAAITGLDADVVGLIEIANDDGDALDTLVAALNAAQPDPADHYTAVQAPALNAPTALGGTYGTDAIRQAIIYRASVVTPAGPPPSDLSVLSPADPLFPDEPVFDRAPAVQTFRPVGGNHDFTVVVNHFKSKGSTNAQCGTPDPFGGNCDDLRERQAQALVELVEDLGATKNAILLGDFNAYEAERPIQILQEAGYVSAVADLPRQERISYSFDGEFGSLDYAFLSKSLAKQQTGADIWNINSFEAVALDYNDFNQPALYRPDAFASSDHDPVLVGLALLPGARGRWTAEQAQGRPRG